MKSRRVKQRANGIFVVVAAAAAFFFCNLYPAAANPPNRRVIAGSRPICRERSRLRLGTRSRARARGAWEMRRGGGNIRIRIRCLHQISRSFMVSRGRARFWHAETRAGTLSKGNAGPGLSRARTFAHRRVCCTRRQPPDRSFIKRPDPLCPFLSLFLTFSLSHCE